MIQYLAVPEQSGTDPFTKGNYMPLYTIKNTRTGEVKDMLLKISAMIEMTSSGEWEQIIGSPALVTHTGNIVNKTSSDWKNHLQKIQKGSSRFVKNSIKV